MGIPDSSADWGLLQRILFRFLFVYFILYNLEFPFNFIPQAASALQPYQDAVVMWVGKQIFQVEITIRPNGSGDTTYNYIQVFCFAVLAATVAALWTLLDRKRTRYVVLDEWLRVCVRFALAAMMILYGSVKVIKSQFPNPSLDRLVQPFGDASPMGLLWTFMGASQSYNVFTGAGEMLGGLLLTFRRTTLPGALVSIWCKKPASRLDWFASLEPGIEVPHVRRPQLALRNPGLAGGLHHQGRLDPGHGRLGPGQGHDDRADPVGRETLGCRGKRGPGNPGPLPSTQARR